MNNIRYAPEAEDDLVAIKNYITQELGSPVAALNTITKIINRIRSLTQFPELGARLSSIIGVDTDYRYLICGNYIAFYHVSDKGELS